MVDMLLLVVAAAAWLVTGAVVGLLQARHGHWQHEWAPFALLGPFALVIAWYQRQLPPSQPLPLIEAGVQPGALNVLAGIDGSPQALAAAGAVVALFGPRVRRLSSLPSSTARRHLPIRSSSAAGPGPRKRWRVNTSRRLAPVCERPAASTPARSCSQGTRHRRSKASPSTTAST